MGEEKLLRVTQMNAAFFDKEINNVFWQQIQDCLKYFPPGFTSVIEPELRLALRLGTVFYSVLQTNQTFGQKLLQIHYKNFTPTKKVLYVLANCFSYIKQRCEMWKPSHDINKVFSVISNLIMIGNFFAISMFLKTGRKPNLVEAVLNLDQAYDNENVRRHFSSKYMARELLWNGLIEVLIYMLPLLNYHKIRRFYKNYIRFHKKPDITMASKWIVNFDTKCPHCCKLPILPHHMGCSHVFCYSCLKGNQEADNKYECPICEYCSEKKICDPVRL